MLHSNSTDLQLFDANNYENDNNKLLLDNKSSKELFMAKAVTRFLCDMILT